MIELIIAFGAGLISFLSPCVLPLIPGYISYISGSSIDELVDKKNINLFPHTDLTIDAVKGIGGMFSLDNGTGRRFLTKSEICLVVDNENPNH